METQTSHRPFLADILIYPTSRCNLKCRHCYFAPTYDDTPGTPDDEISSAQICKAVDELLPFGLRSCKFSGGEPFLRTDLLEMCHHMESKKLRLVIETNGTLVTKHDAEVLGQLRPKVFVSVSVDGADAQTHEALRGVPGSFRRALEGLAHLVQAGLNVQVIAAAYEDNKEELPRVIDLAAKKGAKSFKACFVNPVGRGRNVRRIPPEEMIQLDQRLAAYARSVGIVYTCSVPIALRSINHIMSSCALKSRCNIASTLALLSDGTITICGMGRHAKEFRFGTLGHDDLAELWMNHPTLQLIRNGMPGQLGGICGRCVMKAACLGHCRLDDEYVTMETLFDAYPICATMEKLGRFPAARAMARPAAIASGAA